MSDYSQNIKILMEQGRAVVNKMQARLDEVKQADAEVLAGLDQVHKINKLIEFQYNFWLNKTKPASFAVARLQNDLLEYFVQTGTTIQENVPEKDPLEDLLLGLLGALGEKRPSRSM